MGWPKSLIKFSLTSYGKTRMSFLANWIYVILLLEGVYTQRRHPINEWRLLQDTNEVLSWILAWGAHISVDRREIWHSAFEVHLMRPIVHTRTFLSIPLPLGNVFPNCLKDPAIIMVLFPSKNLPPTHPSQLISSPEIFEAPGCITSPFHSRSAASPLSQP